MPKVWRVDRRRKRDPARGTATTRNLLKVWVSRGDQIGSEYFFDWVEGVQVVDQSLGRPHLSERGALWNISDRVRVGNPLQTGSRRRPRSRSSSGRSRSIEAGLIVAHEPDAYSATGLHPEKRDGKNQEGRSPAREAAEDYHVHTKRLNRSTSAAMRPI